MSLTPKKTKVVIGLSGGIDSAMAASILLREGYEVVGITMTLNDNESNTETPISSGCLGANWHESAESAKKVCQQLNIEHYLVDLSRNFNEIVLSDFKATYLKGETPNPCVICNKRIKFDLLPQRARELDIDFDYFATGHYARIIRMNGLVYLAKGVDATKDQSYFLSGVDRSILPKLMFPLGEYHKKDVKKMAESLGFTDLSRKKESQDFSDVKDYDKVFISSDVHEGDIVDLEGKLLGRHKGLVYYTIGQRKGLDISGLPEPYYVLQIDQPKNRVIVGLKEQLYSSILFTNNINWLYDIDERHEFKIDAKIRFQHAPARCSLKRVTESRYRVDFIEPQMAVTPGQTIAFYHNDILLGGGIIENSE